MDLSCTFINEVLRSTVGINYAFEDTTRTGLKLYAVQVLRCGYLDIPIGC